MKIVFRLGVCFSPQDLWIGMQWGETEEGHQHFHFCLIPTLHLVLCVSRGRG